MVDEYQYTCRTMSLIMRGWLIAKAHCSTMRALGLIVGTMSPTMSPRPHNEAHCSVFGARTNNEPPSLLHSLVHSKSTANPTCPGCPMLLMGAAHKRPAVGMPWPIKPSHRPHPTPRHLPCCPPATSTHAVSLRSVLAGRRVYGEAVQVERGAG